MGICSILGCLCFGRVRAQGALGGVCRTARPVACAALIASCAVLLAVSFAGCDGVNITRNFGWCNGSDEVVEGMQQIRVKTNGGATCGFMFGSEFVAHEAQGVVEEMDVTGQCDPIVYRGAAMSINGGDAGPALAFLSWLKHSRESRALLEERGFVPLPDDGSGGGDAAASGDAASSSGAAASSGVAASGAADSGAEASDRAFDPGDDEVSIAVATTFGPELEAFLVEAQDVYRKAHPNVSFTNVSILEEKNYDADLLTYAERKGLGLMEGKRAGCAVSIAPNESQREKYVGLGWVLQSDYEVLFGDTLKLVTTVDQAGDFQDLGALRDAVGVCMVTTRRNADGSGRYARQVLYGAGLIPQPDTKGAPATDWGDG